MIFFSGHYSDLLNNKMQIEEERAIMQTYQLKIGQIKTPVIYLVINIIYT